MRDERNTVAAAAPAAGIDDRPAEPVPGEESGWFPGDDDDDIEELSVRAAEEVDALGPDAEPSEDSTAPLLSVEQSRRLRSRWEQVQSQFVDDPQNAVEEADELVRQAIDAIDELFDRQRRQLEGIWEREEEISTEDLRVTLRRYRTFFDRLLAI
jgi:hypothetical protein